MTITEGRCRGTTPAAAEHTAPAAGVGTTSCTAGRRGTAGGECETEADSTTTMSVLTAAGAERAAASQGRKSAVLVGMVVVAAAAAVVVVVVVVVGVRVGGVRRGGGLGRFRSTVGVGGKGVAPREA